MYAKEQTQQSFHEKLLCRSKFYPPIIDLLWQETQMSVNDLNYYSPRFEVNLTDMPCVEQQSTFDDIINRQSIDNDKIMIAACLQFAQH